MRLLDLFHPYLGFEDRSSGMMRTASGLALDPATGHLLVVDPDPETRQGHGVYEVTSEGEPVGLVQFPGVEGLNPYGIAGGQDPGVVWLTDQCSGQVLCMDREKGLLTNLEASQLGIANPGVLASDTERSRLFITDRDRNLVVQFEPSGRVINSFELTPFAEARLRGIAAEPTSGHLLLAYAHPVPESNGEASETGIFETTPDGRVLRRLGTDELGFCALDLAMAPGGDTLFAVSREFVLPQTEGDHSQVFVVDVNGAPPTGRTPDLKLVERFLHQNNLRQGSSVTRRWERLPVPVYPDGLADLSEGDVAAVLDEWSDRSGGRFTAELVAAPPDVGVVVTQGEVAFTTGGPTAEGVVVVCICDRSHLPCHPRGMDETTAQRNVARHEIGHAIGFSGHSPRFRIDAMNSVSGYSEGISPEEAAFMEILYSHPPCTPAGEILASVQRLTEGDRHGSQGEAQVRH